MAHYESRDGGTIGIGHEVSLRPQKPVEASDFAESEIVVRSGIAAWMATARSTALQASPAWKNGHAQVQELKSTLANHAGEVVGNIGKSDSSLGRLNRALKLRPYFTDRHGNDWNIQVEHTDETGACRLIWVPSRSDEQSEDAALPMPLINRIDQVDILDAEMLREGIHKLCRLTNAGFDDRRKRRALNAAIRARLLKFDADDIDTTPYTSRKSKFSDGDENKMDAALIALFLRMEEWDYCHRVLVRHDDLATLGYVSAGPLEPGKAEPSTLFKAHADNFVWDDLCWEKPVDTADQVVLCFSGFRIHPELVNFDGVGKVLLRAAWEVCHDFVNRDKWPIENVLLSLHQPTARFVFDKIAGNSIGQRSGDFVRLSTTELENLSNKDQNG